LILLGDPKWGPI